MTLDVAEGRVATGEDVAVASRFSVVLSNSLADIEQDWRALEVGGIESPGQSFDFHHHWIETFKTPESSRVFAAVRAADKPIAVVALQRIRRWGLAILRPFPCDHVGVTAPLIDIDWFASASSAERAGVWQTLRSTLQNADLVHFMSVPETLIGGSSLFGELGLSVIGDRLHRSVFDSWEECNQTQRTRARRKRDRYRMGKLEAIGPLRLEVLGPEDDISTLLAEMFEQRATRFKEQGIADPFADPMVRQFYADVYRGGAGLAGSMHVLYVGDRAASFRYNLVADDRVFCLISSMSAEPDLRDNSPGKVGLTKVLEKEFSGTCRIFDFGAGLNDEKRIWCNRHVDLCHVYMPLTPLGHVFARLHRLRKSIKNRLKSDERLLRGLRNIRARIRGRKPAGDAELD